MLLRALPYTIHAIIDGATLGTSPSAMVLFSLAFPVTLCAVQDVGTIILALSACDGSRHALYVTLVCFALDVFVCHRECLESFLQDAATFLHFVLMALFNHLLAQTLVGCGRRCLVFAFLARAQWHLADPDRCTMPVLLCLKWHSELRLCS